MTLTVREFAPSDAEAAAAVRRAAVPFLLSTAESIAWEAAHSPAEQRFRILVAEADGRVIGVARAGLYHGSAVPGRAFAQPYVLPEARGRGAGLALVRAAEQYLRGIGANAVYAWVLDDGHAPGFAERRGYQRRRPSRLQRLDLVRTPLPDLAPDAGVELRAFADFADDPRPLYETDVEAIADEPGEVAFSGITYENWLEETWRVPLLDRDLSTAAVVDGTVASIAIAHSDGRTRYLSAGTGTRRAYRGRGLAKLVKARSLRLARAAGRTEAFTGNDDENAPMLAVNKWFGYEPTAAEWRYVRELSGSATAREGAPEA
ncbi:GNAT family N-acetyltransferase [Streptomyces varsoviensis]|uniref:GNAT family N-acetyltransferase n=1 Tax=Streptomyces varsoviensis TaxID=67373 RepID=UPI0006624865|nr:GNAT family N-acetyltransferase [Streptomyces varsoviensis]